MPDSLISRSGKVRSIINNGILRGLTESFLLVVHLVVFLQKLPKKTNQRRRKRIEHITDKFVLICIHVRARELKAVG